MRARPIEPGFHVADAQEIALAYDGESLVVQRSWTIRDAAAAAEVSERTCSKMGAPLRNYS